LMQTTDGQITEPSVSAGLGLSGVGPMHAIYSPRKSNSSPLRMSKRCNGE
jgi:tryptophan synthase beta subunit